MIHTMKLQEQYYNYIKKGTKTYEIRLNDEKRKLIKVGDFIEFQKEPLLEDKMILQVDDLLYFNNFDELFDSINIDLLSDKSVSSVQLKSDLELYYSKEKQNIYGVVAIKLKKDIIINHSNINIISYEDSFFDSLKENYNDFSSWFTKMKNNNEEIFYTGDSSNISSIMMLKIKEVDSQQFFEKGNILKIRLFLVNDKNRGIGSRYFKLIDDIAFNNEIDYIYLTVKRDNTEFIDYISKRGFVKYSGFEDEDVYYKII